MDEVMRREGWADLTPQQRAVVPTFFVIGAMKAGSSSLWQLLARHPDVFMSPVKEPGYFAAAGGALDNALPGRARASVRALDDYLALFSAVAGERAIGEATPIYLYFPWVPHRVRDVIEDPRFIAILRNPADRAFSHYVWGRAGSNERAKTFGEAIDMELAGRPDGLGIVETGFYGKYLTTYFDLFDSTQVLVVLQEDLARDPVGTMQSVYGFIGVDPAFDLGERTVYNERRPIVRSRRLAELTAGRSSLTPLFNRLVPAPMRRSALATLERRNRVTVEYPEDTRRMLLDLYAEDIHVLERLIQRDLSAWLN